MKAKEYAVRDTRNALVGSFDGEVVYIKGQPTYRIDDDEVYSFGLRATLIGYLVDGRIETLDGSVLYAIEL